MAEGQADTEPSDLSEVHATGLQTTAGRRGQPKRASLPAFAFFFAASASATPIAA
jgi:hypothetical protein